MGAEEALSEAIAQDFFCQMLGFPSAPKFGLCLAVNIA